MAKINQFHQDEELKIKFGKNEWKTVLTYVSTYKWELLITLFVIAVGVVSATVAPYILKIVFDDAIPRKNYSLLYSCGLVFAITVAFNIFVNHFRMKHLANVGQSIVFDMRRDLFKHLQKLPFVFFDTRPQGKILIRVTSYINSLADMLSSGLVNAIVEFIALIAVVCFMFATDAKLTLVALCGLPVLCAVLFVMKKYQRHLRQVFSNKNSNMTAYLHENINGVKITQAFVRKRKNERIFMDLSVQVFRSWMNTIRIEWLVPIISSVLSEATACLTYFVAIMVISGTPATVGVTIAMINYIGRLWTPINNLANLYNQLITNMTYLERIVETMNETVDICDRVNAKELTTVTGDIRFEHVDFRYDEKERYILKDLMLHVKPGERIALVGQTGAGKTTIVNLLSRYYEIESGCILIDGHDIRDVTLKSLRGQIGYMLQESYVFSGTIMDNIRYGRLDATDEEVIEAAKAVCAHEFISKLKDGYHTVVSEKGNSLSLGQRQLISLARTMLLNPKILILDEATSSVDTETEKAIIEGINRLTAGRTAFMVAHRLSTIVNADRILVVGNQTILEDGSHTELMQQKGYYYNFYTKQSEE